MKRIFVPTTSFEDWRRLLARPDRHWKEGFSAMALARAWEAADGLPPEVTRALNNAGRPSLKDLRPLLVVPEYQVPLPGGERPSQMDVFLLGRGKAGLVAVAVEGKVDETFGPTVGERRAEASEGSTERLSYLLACLGLNNVPDSVRYQLLHRAASAVLVAEEYFAGHALMLIHSFSPTNMWFSDFAAFVALFGQRAEIGRVIPVGHCRGRELLLGWCEGDQRFRLP
jgi:hypothetical protein